MLSTLALAALATACRTAAPAPGAGAAQPPLDLDTTVESPLAAGESISFDVSLAADRYVLFDVRQDEVDAAVRVVSPRGETLGESAGPAAGSERLAVHTTEAGEHALVVHAAEGDGRVLVRLREERAWKPGDEHRVRAVAEAGLGEQWLRAGSAEANRMAIEHLLAAAGHWRRAGDADAEAESLVQTGRAYSRLGEWQRSRELLEPQLPILEAGEDRGEAATAHATLANALSRLGAFAEAEVHFRRALELFREEGSVSGQTIVLTSLGTLALRRDEPQAALPPLLAAEELAGDDPSVPTRSKVTTLVNLGAAHERLGSLDLAFESYERGAALVREHDVPAAELHLLTNLGSYYLAVGRPQDALDSLVRGTELAERLGDPLAEQSLLGLLGRLYRALGDLEAAERHHLRQLAVAETLGDPAIESASLLRLGVVRREKGEAGQARLDFEAALVAAERAAGAILPRAAALRELGSLSVAEGSAAEGLAAIERALVLAEQSEVAPAIASTLRALAVAQRADGRPDEARRTLQRALELNLRLDDPLSYGAVRIDLARLERETGRLEEARALYAEALDTHEQIRRQIASPELRATFLSSWREHYTEYVDLLYDLAERDPGGGHAATALAAGERSRARLVAELLAESKIELRSRMSPELRQREQSLLTQLALLQSDLIAAVAEGDERAAALRERLVEERRALVRLQDEIRRSDATYAGMVYPKPLGLAAIQEMLPAGTTLLEFVLGPRRSFLFAVGADGLEVHALPGEAELAAAVERLRASAQASDPRAAAQLRRTAAELWRMLLAPVAERLAASERLWVVPDGPLFLLPFELLAPAGERLSPAWTISYTPSASVLGGLIPLAPPPRPDGPLFVGFAGPTGGVVAELAAGGASAARLGDGRPPLRPLPGTVEEVEAIAGLFPGRSRLYVGADANQDNVLGNPALHQARWLHFATHGWIGDPSESGLVLSPDADDDPMLHVYEIFNLDLEAEAVVLSACDTGLGGTQRGEGLVGLSHAFFYAGAANVVVSLWPVADRSTGELMRRMYLGLADGLPPAEALRRAKLELIADGRWAGASHWAPFILVGRDR